MMMMNCVTKHRHATLALAGKTLLDVLMSLLGANLDLSVSHLNKSAKVRLRHDRRDEEPPQFRQHSTLIVGLIFVPKQPFVPNGSKV